MSEFIFALLRASLFMAVTGTLLAIVLRVCRVKSPTFHRIAWALVVVQGLMFFRFGFELQILVPKETTAGNSKVEAADFVPKPERDEPHKSGPLFFETKIDRAEIKIESGEFPEPEKPNPVDVFTNSELNTISNNEIEFESAIEPKIIPETKTDATIRPEVKSEQEESYFTAMPIILFGIWGTGAVVAVLLQLISYFVSLSKLRDLRPLKGKFRREWNELLSEYGIGRGKVRVYVSGKYGPWLVRTFRGCRIIVPGKLWEETNSRHRAGILRHELSHYRHGDPQKSFFLRIVASLHWFNPVGWFAIRKFEEAAEWRCDAEAFARSEKGAADFAETLLAFRDTVPLAGLYRVAFVTKGRKLINRLERLIELQQNKGDSKMKKGLLILAACTIFGLGLFELKLTARPGAPNEDSVQPTAEPIDASVRAEPVPVEMPTRVSELDDEYVFLIYQLEDIINGEKEDGEESLFDLIKSVISPHSWGPEKGSLKIDGTRLIVSQTRKNHNQIIDLFEKLNINEEKLPVKFSFVRDRLDDPFSSDLEEPLTLNEAFDLVGNSARIKIIIADADLNAAGISLDEKISPLRLNFRVPVRCVLDFICRPFGLAWIEVNDTIVITTKGNSATLNTKYYYVGDLVATSSGSKIGEEDIVLINFIENPNPAGTGAVAKAVWHDLLEREISHDRREIDFAPLTRLIETLIEPDSWGENGRGSIMEYYNTLSLVIRNTESAHNKISDLLYTIRKCNDMQIVFEIEYISLNDSTLESIGHPSKSNVTTFQAQTVKLKWGEKNDCLVRVSPKSTRPVPESLAAQNKPFSLIVPKGKANHFGEPREKKMGATPSGLA